MGKGDKKTKRGKIVNGSYGRVRRRKKPRIKYEKPVVAEVAKIENGEATEKKSKVEKPVEKKISVKRSTTATAARQEEKETKKPAAKKTAVVSPKKEEAGKPKDKIKA